MNDIDTLARQLMAMLPKGYVLEISPPGRIPKSKYNRRIFFSSKFYKNDGYGFFAFVNCENVYGVSKELTPLQRLRLMYLMTYSNHQNVLRSLRSGMSVEESIMSEFEIQPLAMHNLLNALCNAKALNLKNDTSDSKSIYEFPRDILYRGKITQSELDLVENGQSRYIRVYESGVRRTFRDKLGQDALKYLPLLMVCVHSQNNVLCYNPSEKNIQKVEPVTFIQACDIMGFPKGSMTKVRKTMLNASFSTPHDGRQRICLQSTEDIMGIPAGAYFINPRICFGGGKEVAQQLEPLFKIKE